MDSGTVIIALIIILVGALPFVLVSLSDKRKKKDLQKALLQKAKDKNCSITEFDLWNKSAIGIDNAANHIFYLNKENGNDIFVNIELAEVQKCSISDRSRPLHDTVNNLTIEKLELSFIPSKRDKAISVLEFYNKDYNNLHISEELILAKKWCDRINDRISVLTTV
jgi:hypothetical protein